MPMRRIVPALALAVLVSSPAVAQTRAPIDPEAQAQFKADELRYERELGIIVATGHVEISQGGRILLADRVTYNQREDVVSATGNISLLEPTGDVMFADYFELTGDMKDGTARNIRMKLRDNARMAAVTARRRGGTVTELDRAVFSPCEPCKDDPSAPLTWQIKAAKVVRDTETGEVEYRDAQLEMFGIPVFYTPYFSHPDPSVKRRSGLLTPTIGNDSLLGALVKLPYYIAISPDQDATIAALAATRVAPVLIPQYRRRFDHAELTAEGSVTDGEVVRAGQVEDTVRGHLDARFRADLGETWRGGADVRVASDSTYLRQYGFSDEPTLTSRVFVEGFRGLTYTSGNAYRFQGLRAADDEALTPLILPMLDYHHVSMPVWFGSRWSADANLMMLGRDEGVQSRRLSLRGGWRLPYTTELGEIYTAFASIRTDAYWVENAATPEGSSQRFSGLIGRVFPQAGLEWRFPFVGTSFGRRTVVEPVAQIVASPDNPNPDKIPNEDGRDFELDDTNLLSESRIPGLDRVEGGVRAQYGLRTTLFDVGGGGRISGFIGQSFRLTTVDDFKPDIGLDSGPSDIVGRIDLAIPDAVDLNYRFRINQTTLNPDRTELLASIGPPSLRLDGSYIALDNVDPGALGDREELALRLTGRLVEHWALQLHTRYDLVAGGGPLSYGGALAYGDDCLLVRLSFTREFTSDRDLEPTNTFLIRFSLKAVGDFASPEEELVGPRLTL